MVEVVGDKIFVDGNEVGTVHEYVENTRIITIGG